MNIKLLTTNASDAERADAFGAEKEVNPLDINYERIQNRIEGKSKQNLCISKREINTKEYPKCSSRR